MAKCLDASSVFCAKDIRRRIACQLPRFSERSLLLWRPLSTVERCTQYLFKKGPQRKTDDGSWLANGLPQKYIYIQNYFKDIIYVVRTTWRPMPAHQSLLRIINPTSYDRTVAILGVTGMLECYTRVLNTCAMEKKDMTLWLHHLETFGPQCHAR